MVKPGQFNILTLSLTSQVTLGDLLNPVKKAFTTSWNKGCDTITSTLQECCED